MPLTVYTDADADLGLLAGKTVAVVGYGNQGRAHALNLRDSGVSVIVGQRSGSASFDRAVADGFAPVSAAEAARRGDLVMLLLPDESQADVYAADIRPHLTPDKLLLAAHGFNLRFGYVVPPPGVDAAVVSPKGPGTLVRSAYVDGHGLPCLLATTPDPQSVTKPLALAYAKALGGTRAGVIETTIAEETEADLFGEQVVLCGGMAALVKAAFETLVEAGFTPEVAYFECVHELKQCADLLYHGGLDVMRRRISNTAEYGDYTRGPRVVNDAVRVEMKRILAEVRDGTFAREWVAENRAGLPAFAAARDAERRHPMEEVGRRVRALMPWLR